MTTSQKAAFSLLISVLLFGAFTVLAFTGLFDLLEAHFYDPSITTSLTRDLTRNADEIDRFISETQARFSETLKIPAIRRSFLPNQGAEDIFERSRIYGLLAESVRGLQWVRFIDSSGSRIHFSTSTADILQQDRLSVSYRNFNEPGFVYDSIAVADNEKPIFIFDERGDRILFSFPFYDSFDVYRGTALFSLSVKAVTDRLISDGRIRVGQDLSVISDPKGLLSGMASAGERVLPIQVSTIWKEGWQETARLVSPSSGLSLALITVRTAQGILVGRLVNEEMFLFPQPMKVILLASFFLTVYLTIFLLFNLRQDSVTVVQNRLKQLQISLIEQFYERKGDIDWARWSRELEQRRDEINLQLKHGIKTTAVQDKDLDVLIDKSWDELLSVMGGRAQHTGQEALIDEGKLQVILNRILAALPASGVPAKISPRLQDNLPQSGDEAAAEIREEAEAMEELAEELIEDIEVAEAVDELEEAEALEEIEEAEAVIEDAVEELAEDIEVCAADDAVRSISTGTDVEELEELADADEAEGVEELEEEKAPPPIPTPDPSQIAKLASQIEFAVATEPESTGDVPLGDFEVVSPFSSMTFDFSETDDDLIFLEEEEVDESTQNTPAVMVENVSGAHSTESFSSESAKGNRKKIQGPSDMAEVINGSSLMSKPFFNAGSNEPVETLEALDGEDDIPTAEAIDDDNGTDAGIIEEREGVPYINGDVLGPGEEDPDLNQDFKNLVDSVIK